MIAASILVAAGMLGTYVSYRENAPRVALLWAFGTGLTTGIFLSMLRGLS
jgi:hypothetical protein